MLSTAVISLIITSVLVVIIAIIETTDAINVKIMVGANVVMGKF